MWKTSCGVLVPKTSHPKALSSYMLMAPTSYLMRTLEKWILVLPLVRSSYQPDIGMGDTIIFVLHRGLPVDPPPAQHREDKELVVDFCRHCSPGVLTL